MLHIFLNPMLDRPMLIAPSTQPGRRPVHLVLGAMLFGFAFLSAETTIAQTPTSPRVADGSAAARHGRVIEGKSVPSDLLGREIPYSVYLPPGYASSERSYPAVYLLHGYTDDETAWVQFGEVHQAADRGIASQAIPPMVIVMPDADSTWYINGAAGTEPYEDAIIREFIPAVEETYRIRSEKQFRGVAGLSMGGYGTLLWGMHHPDMFVAAAAFSAGVVTDEKIQAMPWEEYQTQYGSIYGVEAKAEKRVTEHYRANSPLHLARTMPVDSLRSVRWYIDCGDDDFLYEGNSRLHLILRDREVPHEYRVRDGAHSWTYWRSHIGKGLAFIGESFRR